MFEEFINRLKSDAKNGNIEAKYQLGSTYHWGYKVARDSNQAIYWYSRAIEEGHVISLKVFPKILSKELNYGKKPHGLKT